MKNKLIGSLLILVAIILVFVLYTLKIQINTMADSLMQSSNGKCYLENGKCVHQQSFLPFIIGAILSVFTTSLGIYLILFSRTAESFEAAQKNIISTLKNAKNEQTKEEKFKILLTGLDEDEKKALLAVKEQDGISQSTLKFRTDLSKTKLSIVLSQLEKKGLIAKVKKGKINNIFLKKAL
ncbi:hypothetical protein HYX01_03110 [Candidatus Woesearchaeota archaeon]|nr:hypothetical protein [Candidatus Woesearchaeota archaeon]